MRGVLILGGALAICFFVLDLVMPFGMAVVGYVFVVVVAGWMPERRYVLGAAGVCSLLLLLGYLWTPASEGADRLMVGVVIWATAGVIGVAQPRPASARQRVTNGQDQEQPGCAGCDRLRVALEAKQAELEHFTYIVSHDLRTPLVTIQGFADFLQMDVQDGDQEQIQADVACLTEGVHTLEQQLNALLDLSRIRRKVSAPAAVALHDLIADTLEQVATVITERGVTVRVAPDLPMVYVDRFHMLDVIRDVVVNAIENCGEVRTPTLDIGVQGIESTAGIAVCFFRDNGSPVAPHHQKKMFDPFAHLEQAASGKRRGLARARRIVEVHGGHMWMSTGEKESGNILYISLPIEEHSIERGMMDAPRQAAV